MGLALTGVLALILFKIPIPAAKLQRDKNYPDPDSLVRTSLCGLCTFLLSEYNPNLIYVTFEQLFLQIISNLGRWRWHQFLFYFSYIFDLK